jgi:hypothetical protein
VICGHIHQPQKRIIETNNGSVTYLNSGDWVEHLTALEYYNKDWHIYEYDETKMKTMIIKEIKPEPDVMTNEIAFYLHSRWSVEQFSVMSFGVTSFNRTINNKPKTINI